MGREGAELREPAAGVAAAARPLILHVRVVVGAGGGPDSAILASEAHLRAAGYASAAAYLRPPGDAGYATLERRAAARDYALYAIDDRWPLDPSVLGELAALCRRLGVAVWHGHDYKSNLAGLLVRRRHAMALVSTAHGWVTRTRRLQLYYAVDRWCLRRYDHVMSVSPDLDAAVAALGVPATRRTMIGNGVDAEHFRRGCAEGADWRVRQGIPVSRQLILAVGRLSDEKRFDDLISAAAHLLAAGADIHVLIAGDGPARGHLQALIDRLGIGQRVALLGVVEDPRTLYDAGDVFVLSSVREGMPTALLEAMAMGLAVVSSDVGGVANAIRAGENGLLYPMADVPALTQALRRCVDDGTLRARLGVAARATVEARFTLAARVRAEIGVYARLRATAR